SSVFFQARLPHWSSGAELPRHALELTSIRFFSNQMMERSPRSGAHAYLCRISMTSAAARTAWVAVVGHGWPGLDAGALLADWGAVASVSVTFSVGRVNPRCPS